jgi:hypothetical protein
MAQNYKIIYVNFSFTSLLRFGKQKERHDQVVSIPT